MRKGIYILVVMAVIVSFLMTYQYYKSVDLGSGTVSLIVRSGDSFNSVARQLVDSGVVQSRFLLVWPARLLGIDRKLVPGLYKFSGGNSCSSVLDKLASARFELIKVTIIEGAPIWKVAQVLKQTMSIDSATLIALNHDSAFLASMSLPSLEGYLYPQTYFFPWGATLKEIIGQMNAMFHDQTDSLSFDDVPNDLTRTDIIVLASIIEAEARLDDEKGIISSVYHNRLARDMKLQADPTVIYGLGGLDRPLYKKDLKKKSPYNTYLRSGLPPTAINSPGLAAIRAAIYPDSTSFLYFVADGSGRHRFTRSNSEHNRAIREIRKGRK